MNRRTAKQAQDHLMADGASSITETCKRRYHDRVKALMERLENAPTKGGNTTGIKDWMIDAIFEINRQFRDPAFEEKYLEHADPEVRLIYITYAWTAMEFSKSMTALADCIVSRDIDAVAYEAFRAGTAFAALDHDLLAKRKQRASIERTNASKRIGSEEVRLVKSLNATLETDMPKPGPRYREIAERLSIKPDRVRYIVEGPRR